MKKAVVVAFLLGLTSSIANAQAFQATKPIICDETQKVIKSLTENYKEKPIWLATGEGTKFSLLVNKETGSWTLLQFTAEVACILGVGKDSELIFGDSI